MRFEVARPARREYRNTIGLGLLSLGQCLCCDEHFRRLAESKTQ